jgi:hypothetical protein
LDDIYTQLENPGKFKPVIPALNAKQIIIKKETSRKQSAEKIVSQPSSSQERDSAKKSTVGRKSIRKSVIFAAPINIDQRRPSIRNMNP